MLAGETVTVSVMVGGAVYRGTGTSRTGTVCHEDGEGLGYAAGYMHVGFPPSDINVTGVKLEIGTISTLAYDPPMDYGVELMKCHRYFLNLGSYAFWQGYAFSSTVGVGYISVPKMRIIHISTIILNGGQYSATIRTAGESTGHSIFRSRVPRQCFGCRNIGRVCIDGILRPVRRANV